MRNIQLTLMALVLGWTIGQAQEAPQGSPLPWGANPFLKAKGGSVHHDFGSVPHGAQLAYRFPITNIYKFPITVSMDRISCGCVTASPKQQIIQPLESGFLDITMNAGHFTGNRKVRISMMVTAIDPQVQFQHVSWADLTVSANSRQDVVLTPGEASFGMVQRGQMMTQAIDIKYAGALDWGIQEIATNDAPLQVALKQLYRQAGNRRSGKQVGYRLELTLKPDAPAGRHRWELFLKTNDPTTPLIPVQVEANIQDPLMIAGGALSGISAKINEPLERSVMVRSTQPNQSFRILSIEGLGDGIDLANQPSGNAAPNHRLTFRMQMTTAGPFQRVLQIKTDLQDAPIPLTIDGNAQP